MKHPRILITPRRRSAGLSRADLAELVGITPAFLSDLANGRRAPSLKYLLALEAVFGLSSGKLFPESYEVAEEAAMVRAKRLEERHRNRTDERSLLILRFLDSMAERTLDHDRA